MARLPSAFRKLRKDQSDVVEAYERFAGARFEAGPLDLRPRNL